ncbi:polyprenyl synthetase family protein [Salinarimonas soli]|uniref:Probable farnesyl diphosphate synthase n=1 Tax=Salinarimonas soli TaxID=1638099 RepID=A0A5B2VGM3_9HYPH|nr:polyprenyl synthetase family protein [Salinarimonas soli]KAA2238065.1 polyprenyl synthetase family protein [Salinarimonas soli]
MTAMPRIERALQDAITRAEAAGAPPRLGAALRHAVFPGGARVRPMLCLAVARACGDDRPELADAAAAAIEFLHCASLVHDDLPCFDDAATRRGRPSVHAAFGEPLAVLAGDALIVLAFETLGRAGFAAPDRLPRLLATIAAATGMPHGIVAGQAWECEPSLDLSTYHRAKTGALFTAATLAGAVAAAGTADAWSLLGERLGEAYQVADDLHDVASDAEALGKPVGQDAAHGRANAVHRLGLDGAVRHLRGLVAEALDSIPDCDGSAELRALIGAQAKRFVPTSLATRVAA